MSEAAIGRVNELVVAAFGRRDAAAVAACYTEDGKLMAPFAAAHVGRAAIERAVEQGFTSGIAALALETVSLEVLGGTAWEEGHFYHLGRRGRVARRRQVHRHLAAGRRRLADRARHHVEQPADAGLTGGRCSGT